MGLSMMMPCNRCDYANEPDQQCCVPNVEVLWQRLPTNPCMRHHHHQLLKRWVHVTQWCWPNKAYQGILGHRRETTRWFPLVYIWWKDSREQKYLRNSWPYSHSNFNSSKGSIVFEAEMCCHPYFFIEGKNNHTRWSSFPFCIGNKMKERN